LETLPNSSTVATSIRADDTVVGYGENEHGTRRPFICRPGGVPQELPAFNGHSEALDINDFGVIVGYVTMPALIWPLGLIREQHAVVWEFGKLYDLNIEYATDIYDGIKGFGSSIPDLTLIRAAAINNQQQIVGSSMTSAGKYLGWGLNYQLHARRVFLPFQGIYTKIIGDVVYDGPGIRIRRGYPPEPVPPFPPYRLSQSVMELLESLQLNEEAFNLSNRKVAKSTRKTLLKSAIAAIDKMLSSKNR